MRNSKGQFISGHNSWNTGLEGYTNSGTFKKGHKSWNKGVPRTLEEKIKISLSTKGKSHYKARGVKKSIETRRKMSRNLFGNKRGVGHKVSKKHKEILRKKRLHQIFPSKDTKIELRFQSALREHGYKFKTHVPLFGQPDIFIEPNVCVFADGDYWHGLSKAVERDKRVNRELEGKGYKVLRYSGRMINTRLQQVLFELEHQIPAP